MISTELLSTLQGLNRADKLYIVQVLISELAKQEADLIKPEQSYKGYVENPVTLVQG